MKTEQAQPFGNHKRLSGGVLIYVLILLTLISSMLLVAIWAAGLGKQAQYRVYHQSLANDNLESGLTYYSHKIRGGDWEGQLYEEEADSIKIREEYWGLYSLLLAEATHERAKDSIAAFAGCDMNPRRKEALYLANLGQPLMISGNTQLSGGLRLPAQGIQSARINGTGFQGSALYAGETYRSGKNLPRLRFLQLEAISSMLGLTLSSGASGASETLEGELKQSWFEPMRVEQSSGKMILGNSCSFEGKILLVSSEEIEISPGAKLENLILVAPVIRFQSGFTGTVQAFASAMIELDSMVELQYPSALMLLPQVEVPSLRIGKRSTLEGVCAMMPLKLEDTPELGSGYIAEEAEIWGMSHLEGTIDFRGIHHGSLAVKAFSFDGTSRMYRNTLVNARIDGQISEKYAVPLWEGSTSPWRIMKWLP